jgi:hypothetical protein
MLRQREQTAASFNFSVCCATASLFVGANFVVPKMSSELSSAAISRGRHTGRQPGDNTKAGRQDSSVALVGPSVELT